MKKNELVKILEDKGIEKNEAKAEVELDIETVLGKTKEELLFIDEFNDEKISDIINK